jgi:Glycosyl-4,4'-diaponeurosporenoate acyltransferase
MHIGFDSTILVIPASVAGGMVGMLAVWNRRPRKHGENNLLRIAVLLSGSVAFVVSLLLFAKALGARSVVFAVTVTVLVAAWTGMFHTVVPLGLPASILKVRKREFTVLRWRWTGVALFGLALRTTPLRHLGGSVYLAQCANDSARVLRGLQEAEEIHIWSVLLCFPWLVFWCMQGLWFSAASSLAVHALLNVYPILHLRLTRGRMERYAARFARRKHA